MAYAYDPENVFAKILRGEIPNRTVLETAHSLAFHDIAPKAPVHVLVIPRGPYVCWDHFAAAADDAEIADFTRAVAEVARIAEVAPGAGGAGYRLISNAGANGVQEVPHLHVHVMGGHPMGPMVLLR
jgi:histidine triad (HIT) family protein